MIIIGAITTGLSANCVCGYRHWRVQERRLQHARKRKSFIASSRPGNAGACGDGSQWTGALV